MDREKNGLLERAMQNSTRRALQHYNSKGVGNRRSASQVHLPRVAAEDNLEAARDVLLPMLKALNILGPSKCLRHDGTATDILSPTLWQSSRQWFDDARLRMPSYHALPFATADAMDHADHHANDDR